jgi:hypothetical protein
LACTAPKGGQVSRPGVRGVRRDASVGHDVQYGLSDYGVLLHAHPLVDTGESVGHSLRHVDRPVQVGGEYLQRVDIHPVAAGVQLQRVGRGHELAGERRRRKPLAVVEHDGDDVLLRQLGRQRRDRVGLAEPALAEDEDVRVGRAAPRVRVPEDLFFGLGVRSQEDG